MEGNKNKRRMIWCFVQVAVCVLILLTFSMKWCMKYFGNIGMNEIMFTLNMPLKGASNEYYATYLLEVFTPTVFVCILFVLSSFISDKS